MINFKVILLICSVLTVFLTFTSSEFPTNTEFSSITAISASDTTKWEVPESANAMANPILNDDASVSEGALIYRKHCRSCHGKLGDGNGAGIADLETPVPSFLTPEFSVQTDGALFWKTSEGREEMPSFKKKIPEEEDLWNLINYIRATFTEFSSITAISASDTTKWEVPESANAMANPILNDDASVSEGALIYRKHCRSCHGKLGDGNGAGIADLETPVPSFLTPEFSVQTDGALFWKTSEGREEMPSFKKKIPEEEDLWNLINYIRATFK
jgi:mono/diheme cytochrome c family protein